MMSPPNPADPAHDIVVSPLQSHCRLCRQPMRSDVLFCPECLTPVKSHLFAPANATVMDYVLAVGSALLALGVTLPLTGMLVAQLNNAQWGDAFVPIVAITLWNGWFLGIPLFACGRRWIWRIRRGEFDHRLVWREYWQMQCATLIPVFMALSCVVLSYLWAGFQGLLGSRGLSGLS